MAEGDDATPLTEFVMVPCFFVTGAAVEVIDGVVRIVAWTHLPEMSGETTERRIVTRVAMPTKVARQLFTSLRRKVEQGGH